MYERIIEIIVYVIAELRHNKTFKDIDINELQELGYTKSEISTAFSWLADRSEFADNAHTSFNARNVSFRILHDVERDLFTHEALGDLIQYQTLGIISIEQIEMLIERTVMMGMQKVSREGLKIFLANTVFNIQTGTTHNSRLMLKGNDTIN